MSPAIRITRTRARAPGAARRNDAGSSGPGRGPGVEARGHGHLGTRHEAAPLAGDELPARHDHLRAHVPEVGKHEEVRPAPGRDPAELPVEAEVLGRVQAGHLVGGHRREPAVDRPLDDAVHVAAREQIGRPDPIGGQRRPAKGHVLVADLEDGLQVAPHRAFADHDAHAEAEPLERLPGRDRLVAGVQPGRGAGDEPGPRAPAVWPSTVLPSARARAISGRSRSGSGRSRCQ